MSLASRDKDGIDVVALYFGQIPGFETQDKWNQFLSTCRKTGNYTKLGETLYGLQVGMFNATKDKMNVEKLNVMFVRWCRSIELTVKKMLLEKNSVSITPGSAEEAIMKSRVLAEVEHFRKRYSF
jgi:hypothetical protein